MPTPAVPAIADPISTGLDGLLKLLTKQAHGLHRTDLNALVVILDTTRRREAISPVQLAHALHLSASATTAVPDRLEDAGHVERDQGPSDRRKIQLLMPDTAIRLSERFFRRLGAELSQAWATFHRRRARASIARVPDRQHRGHETVRSRPLAKVTR